MKPKIDKPKKAQKSQWPRIRLARHRSGGQAWLVDARIQGKGERYFFKTKIEAETKAGLLRTQRKNEGVGGVNIPEKLRVEALECAELLKPFGKRLRDAVQFYLPHLKILNKTCKFSTLIDELIEAKKADRASERYLGDLRSRLGQFSKGMGDKVVSEITASQIENWLRELPVAPTSRNNSRRLLVVAFNFAAKRGYCIGNPAVESDKAKETEGTVGILTVDQTKKLLKVAPVELRAFIAIGAFAGLRRAELTRLDWCDVDLNGGLIEVTAKNAKSARRRFVKIRSNLEHWLKPIAAATGPVAPPNFRELLDLARDSAEIVDWPNNALRHGFASYALAAFNDAAALALELGHTNANLVFQHYRQVVKPAEAAKYWQIGLTTEENDAPAKS